MAVFEHFDMDYLGDSFNIFLSHGSRIIIFIIITIIFVALFVYNWKRRFLYYYSTVLPGPLSLPFIGTPKIVFAGLKNVYSIFNQLVTLYPSVWRYWLGQELYIASSRLIDVEYFLTNCLKKENIIGYQYTEEYCSCLLTSNIDKWKLHRKLVNPSFNQRVINSFHPILVKYANKLTAILQKSCGENPTDILPIIWRCTLDSVFETVGGVNPNMLPRKNTKFIPQIIRYEELLMKRLFNPQYYFNFLWRMTSSHKELIFLVEDMKMQVKELIDYHRKLKTASSATEGSFHQQKSFVDCLNEGGLLEDEITSEIIFMFVAASETTAITICLVLLILSIYPNIQKNIQNEQEIIFGNINREITLEDLNHFDYLERVIKETMRVLPAAPVIARYVDETVRLASQVFPQGSIISFPIFHINRDPKYWTNPSKFDPDRFLSEQMAQRSRFAYVPFSYGPRNCIGQKYGMMIMKLVLSSILRRFEVNPGKYKSFEDVKMVFHFVAKPEDGFYIHLQRRHQ